ncbi:MFS transporter [Nonomuraea rosea]|uniref:MFS transporter n=1 Tax=Nonomuraea rosea TaxID=638574 RepID=A0ABP6YB41_9ACTN
MPPRRTRPVVNRALAAMIEQAGWTHAATAQHVNAVAAESGERMHYDRSAVGHWLTGTVPRPEAVHAVVEAFRRRLNRMELAPADFGWPDPAVAPPADDPWRGDPVARLATLGEDDLLNRRTVLTAGTFTLAALSGLAAVSALSPHRGAGWADGWGRGWGRTDRRAVRPGAGDVARIRGATASFADLDDQFGGGHARAAVAAYLAREVTPLLHEATGRSRPDLFTAAAELSYLAAYMAMDAGAHALAQRYYISAVRLADEAGDLVLRATALRSMAVQAAELGHDGEALTLAEAAASALAGQGPQRTQAWITGMRAEAHAAAGTRWDALSLLRRTEAQLERADSVPESEWTGNYRRESLEHQIGLTLTQLGDHATAARHFAASMNARRPVERRTRTLIGLRAAHAFLRAGEIDRAAATALDLSDDVRLIASARVGEELHRLRTDWQRYRGNPLIARADRLISGASRGPGPRR